MAKTTLQTAVDLLYPARCISCSNLVESDFGLCATCWRETRFIGGTICDTCSAPLMGETDTETSARALRAGQGAVEPHADLCDDCLKIARPWDKGRSALLYSDNGRKLILGLKHGDRQDMVYPAARWMAAAAKDILLPDMVVTPVPLHWTRMIKRRYNQSALLGQALSEEVALQFCPDLLIRSRRTRPLDGMSVTERFAHMRNAIHPHPKRRSLIADRPVLLVDDVLTTGATLAAAAMACRAAGASHVCVATLARAVKEP